MREAVVVAGVRTPIGKAPRGALSRLRADDLAAAAIRAALERTPGLAPGEVEDVVLGCAQPEGEQGMNVARIAALRAGLPPDVPAMTVNRYCASGLQAVALVAQRILAGEIEVGIAGGVETMSHVPMGGHRPSPNPWLMAHYPEVYMAMGHTAEEVARRWGIPREDQDRWALQSHRRAAAAIAEGRFADEVVPVEAPEVIPGPDGRPQVRPRTVTADEGVRFDTSPERLAALPPVFQEGGTVTAGNSSQTSDGAAALVLMSARRAEALGLRPRAAFRAFAVAGCEPEVMGIGPVRAVPKALRAAGLALADVDLVELNEAFAAQVLACMRELDLDPERVNVNGGAIALGHPLGCTGARQLVTLMHEAPRRRAQVGLVTMCVGGGMGAAGVFEFV